MFYRVIRTFSTQPPLQRRGAVTLMPVLVASLTASSRPSNFGLKVTVKAQSMIRPEIQAGVPLDHSPHAMVI